MKDDTIMSRNRIAVLLLLLPVRRRPAVPAIEKQVADDDAPDSLVHVPATSIRSGEIVIEAAGGTAGRRHHRRQRTGGAPPAGRRTRLDASRRVDSGDSAVIGDHAMRKGDVLALIFSPEFSAAQGDYLLAHERAEGVAGRSADSSIAGIARPPGSD